MPQTLTYRVNNTYLQFTAGPKEEVKNGIELPSDDYDTNELYLLGGMQYHLDKRVKNALEVEKASDKITFTLEDKWTRRNPTLITMANLVSDLTHMYYEHLNKAPKDIEVKLNCTEEEINTVLGVITENIDELIALPIDDSRNKPIKANRSYILSAISKSQLNQKGLNRNG